MAIIYTWDCRTVDTYPTHSDQLESPNTENDVIYNVHWRLTGIETVGDVDYSETVIGTQTLSTEDLSSFSSFDTLTNDDVAGWVQSAMGEERVASLEASISSSIQLKITPASVTKYIVDTE